MADLPTNLQDLQDNATGIAAAVESIATAITTKGGTVPNNPGLVDFPSAIGSIPAGGSLGTKSILENGTYQASSDNLDGYSSVTVNVPSGVVKPVRFYDYDGTLITSYTAEEFAALESLPANPTHAGLTSQGWNWSLSDAKTFVANNGRLDVGQMYATDDGRTRFYITLREGRLNPTLKLYLYKNSTVDVDWGDGSAHSELSNTGSAAYVGERHFYSAPGKYVISVKVTSGTVKLQSASTYISNVISNGSNSTSSPDVVYSDTVTHVEVGTDFTEIGVYSFLMCHSLKTITLHNAITGISDYVFSDADLSALIIPNGCTICGSYSIRRNYNIKVVSLPNSITTFGSNVFDSCYSLETIVIPGTLTTTGNNIFINCDSLKEAILSVGITSLSGTGFFNACKSLRSIKLPTGLTAIQTSMFNDCVNLMDVDVPNAVTSVGNAAFNGCSSLTSVKFPSGISFGSNVFTNCISLAETCLPESVVGLGGSMYSGCKALITFEPPEGITTIPTTICDTCSSLAVMTIPSTVTSIAGGATGSCGFINIIKFKPLIPPTLGNGTSIVAQSWTQILVPFASYDAYMKPKSYYPDPAVYTYYAYGTFVNGETLPSSSDNGAYTYTWYASLDDAVAGQNPITVGNGNEVYAVGTQVIVSIVMDFSNNTMEQVGNPQSLSVYSSIIRCNVDNDGTITKRADESGYNNNGTKGQVMSYIPKFYYKMTPITLDGVHIRKAKWEVADTKVDNSFKVHPAFIDVNGNEVDYFLYGSFAAVGQNSSGGYNTSYNTTDYKLSSAGNYTPSSSLTRATARTMATNRGTGWYNAGFKQLSAIQMLIAVEYGFNSQVAIGRGVVSGSIKSTNSNTNDGKSTAGSKTGSTTPVYWRGIENLWGNIWNWIDGININDHVPYICNSYSFEDDTATGYTQIGFAMSSTIGWITAFGYDANNDYTFLPSETIASQDVPSTIGDYYGTSDGGWRIYPIGGSWVDNDYVGLFDIGAGNTSATSSQYFGARLMYVPTAATE